MSYGYPNQHVNNFSTPYQTPQHNTHMNYGNRLAQHGQPILPGQVPGGHAPVPIDAVLRGFRMEIDQLKQQVANNAASISTLMRGGNGQPPAPGQPFVPNNGRMYANNGEFTNDNGRYGKATPNIPGQPTTAPTNTPPPQQPILQEPVVPPVETKTKEVPVMSKSILILDQRESNPFYSNKSVQWEQSGIVQNETYKKRNGVDIVDNLRDVGDIVSSEEMLNPDNGVKAVGFGAEVIEVNDCIVISREVVGKIIDGDISRLAHRMKKVSESTSDINSLVFISYLDKFLTKIVNDLCFSEYGIDVESYMDAFPSLGYYLATERSPDIAAEFDENVSNIIEKNVLDSYRYIIDNSNDDSDISSGGIGVLNKSNVFYIDKYSMALGLEAIGSEFAVAVDIASSQLLGKSLSIFAKSGEGMYHIVTKDRQVFRVYLVPKQDKVLITKIVR